MLNKVTVPISLSGGLETKQDKKLVIRGKLTKLENGVLAKGGAGESGETLLTIFKRNGYEALGKDILGGGAIGSGDALNLFEDELLMFDSQKLYSYAGSVDSWADKGRVVPLLPSIKPVIRNSREQTQSDSAIAKTAGGGVIVYAWKDSSGGVRASVIDEASGNAFQSDVLLNATASKPRCVEIGGNVFVVYVDGTSYKQRKLNPAAPLAFDAEVTIATDVHAVTKHHDIVKFNQRSAVFAYRNTGGDLKVAYLTEAGHEGTALTGYPAALAIAEVPLNCLTVIIHPTTFQITLAFQDSANGVRAMALNQNFTVAYPAVTIDATPGAVTPIVNITGIFSTELNCKIYYEVSAAQTYNHLVRVVDFAAGGGMGVQTFKRSVGLASKAFMVSGSVYVNLVYDSVLQSTYFTCKDDGFIIGRILSGVAGGLLDSAMLPQVCVDPSARQFFTAGVKTKLVSEGGNVFTLRGVNQVTFDFVSTSRYFAEQMGKNLHLVGGFLSNYDGLTVTEHGFHLYPENFSAVAAGAGGHQTNGNRQYVVVWEWVDNKGQIHRSAPSVALPVALAGGTNTQQVTLTIPTLRLTAKDPAFGRAAVVAVAYRTEDAGQTFYRVSPIGTPVYNDTTADTITIIDGLSDADLISHEILYTQGGILPNDPPPTCRLIATSKTRVILAGLDDELAIAYSRAQVDGEGIAFSEELRKRVNQAGGKVTAIAVMDEKVIIWKKDRIFWFSGDGPNDTGADDRFTEPEFLTSDAGCEEPNSVVVTPRGLMFKSAKGIYLLTRGLTLEYVGKAVEAYNGLSIASADLLGDQNQVRFVTSGDVALVYDYFFDEWSVYTNHGGKDSVIWQGQYTYLRKDGGTVYLETPGKYLDDNVGIKLTIATAWIKLAGVQGFQRVYRAIVLGDYHSDHVLRVKVGYDYNDEFLSEYLFKAKDVLEAKAYGDDAEYGDDVYGSNQDGLYQFRMHLEHQKCEAIRFQFEDVMSDEFGKSFSLTELALEVGMKRGLNKLRAEKSL